MRLSLMDAARIVGFLALAAAAAYAARSIAGQQEQTWNEQPGDFPYIPEFATPPYVPIYFSEPTPAPEITWAVDETPFMPWTWNASEPATTNDYTEVAYSPAGVFDSFSFTPAAYGFDTMNNANVQAFLAMIRTSETGSSGPDSYRTIFGGQTFDSFADHPRIAVKSPYGWTSAAGAYQFLARSPIPGTTSFTRWDTWGEAKRALGLTDFSPPSQDAAAVYLIKRRGALPDVIAGRFSAAVARVAKEWASLPGAGYGQPEVALEKLRQIYLANGGNIETV